MESLLVPTPTVPLLGQEPPWTSSTLSGREIWIKYLFVFDPSSCRPSSGILPLVSFTVSSPSVVVWCCSFLTLYLLHDALVAPFVPGPWGVHCLQYHHLNTFSYVGPLFHGFRLAPVGSLACHFPWQSCIEQPRPKLPPPLYLSNE